MLWDLNEGKHLYTLDGGDIINALCFSPNRYWLCAATGPSIKIWVSGGLHRGHTLRQSPVHGTQDLGFLYGLTAGSHILNERLGFHARHNLLVWISPVCWSLLPFGPWGRIVPWYLSFQGLAVMKHFMPSDCIHAETQRLFLSHQ